MRAALATRGLSFRRASRADRSLALVGALAAGSAALLAPALPVLARLAPACLFHAVTGLPCPACGSTRAALALARGDVTAALAWNPLATLALAGAFVAGALAPLWVAVRGPLPVLAQPLSPRVRVALVLVVALDWAWLVAKGV